MIPRVLTALVLFFLVRSFSVFAQQQLDPSLPMEQIPEQVDFEDYKTVDGVNLPFTIKMSFVSPQRSATRTFTEIKHNQPLSNDKFAEPPANNQEQAPAALLPQRDASGNPIRRAPTGHVSNYDEAKVGTYTLPEPHTSPSLCRA